MLKDYSIDQLKEELRLRENIAQYAATWTDSETGLEWQAENIGEMTWDDAVKYAKKLTLNGKSDWRLPTRKELFSLVDGEKYNPCCKTDKLNCVSSYYWSSTTYAFNTSSAWLVNFSYGSVSNGNKSVNVYVRCVRGGQ